MLTKRYAPCFSALFNKGRTRLMVILLFCLCSTYLQAQNRSSLKGKIIDSLNQTPLSKATIAIISSKDSSLIAYTLTDDNGSFTMHNLPTQQQLGVLISYVGYQNHRERIQLKEGQPLELKTILMHNKNLNLAEVVVNGDRPPVVFNRDTIEFSAEAFKVRPNAVVEQLLNRLPGLQVNSDGTILVNGKSVSKILLNGHEYFSNDPRIASKNLDAALIDKVQIYDDRDNDPDNLIDESKLNKIINLKFKKKYKKSLFGKAYAGGGTDDRYETGVLLNSLRDTLQVSLIGFSNNLSRTAFSRDDLSSLGGFNRGGQDQINGGNVVTGGKISDGIQKVTSGGLNINNDYGKKLKMNFLFFVSHTVDSYNKKALNESFLNDTTLTQNQINSKVQMQTSYNLSSLIQWNPSATDQIKYIPHFVLNNRNLEEEIFADQYDNFNSHVNRQLDTTQTFYHPNQFDHTLSYFKKLSDLGESLSVTHKLTSASANTRNFLNNKLISYTVGIGSDTLHQLNTAVINTFESSVDVNYRHPFSNKFTGILTYTNAYAENKEGVNASAYNGFNEIYNSNFPSQTADITRKALIQTVKPGLMWKPTGSVSLQVEMGNQWQNINNVTSTLLRPDKENYYFILPSVNLQVKKWSVNYNESAIQPSITDLNPALIKATSYYSLQGNPFLSPARLRNATFNYYNYNTDKQMSLLIFATASTTQNTIYYHTSFGSSGVQIVTPRNGAQTHSAFIGGNLTKQFNKVNDWQISLKGNIYQGFKDNIVSVNAYEGKLNYYYLIAAAECRINYKDIFELIPHYEINPSYFSYVNVPYSSVTNLNQKLLIKYNVTFSNSFYLEGDFTHFYDSQIANGFPKSYNVLNSALVFQFLKQRNSQFKLSAFDLLNQNISVFRTVTVNNLYQGQNLIQKRYFLLTYQFRFTKSIKPNKP